MQRLTNRGVRPKRSRFVAENNDSYQATLIRGSDVQSVRKSSRSSSADVMAPDNLLNLGNKASDFRQVSNWKEKSFVAKHAEGN